MVFTQKALKHFLKICLVYFSGPFDRKDTMAGAFAVALMYELILSHLIGWKT